MGTSTLFAGIDGGGTKSHLAACDQTGNITAFGETGPTNHQSTEDAVKNFTELFTHLAGRHIDAVALTLGGWDLPHDHKIMRANVAAALEATNVTVGELIFDNDVFAVLKSGIGEQTSGVAVVAGTGTVAVGIKEAETYRTAGMGYLLGEWGSGPEMSVLALHLAFASHFGRREPCPVLSRKAVEFFGVADMEELHVKLCTDDIPSREMGRFLAGVHEAHVEGCPTATEVLTRGGRELAASVCALLEKINVDNAPVVVGGGVFKNLGVLPGMREALQERLGRVPELRIVRSDPVYGALLWAAQRGGAGFACFAPILAKIEVEVMT